MTGVFALIALVAVATSSVQAALIADQDFVVVGEHAIAESFAVNPDLEQPVLLETGSGAEAEAEGYTDAELELLSPRVIAENKLIAENEALLSNVELLAHQMGAPVLSELAAEQAATQMRHIQRMVAGPRRRHSIQYLNEDQTLPTATALLERAPPSAHAESLDEDASLEQELAMIETAVELDVNDEKNKKHNYAYIDDPKHGGAATVMKNLQGLDVYIVNTPIEDNDHEIRPVPPPRPMSSSDRERSKLAAVMRRSLIHSVPQPKARVKPSTKINTMSAYEETLSEPKPFPKNSADVRHALMDPLVGGAGARMMRSASLARFQQKPKSDSGLPSFPSNEPAAASESGNLASSTPQPIVVGLGSSFDNRDGPPVKLDDLLPIKAVLVEELDPLGINAPGAGRESKPNGW